MRRIAVLVALAAVVATALPSPAGVPVLDGKKVRSAKFSFAVSAPQQHLLAETVENPVDAEVTTSCVAPRCYAVPFTVKPAKGVSASTPLSVRIAWTLPTSRFWVHLMDVTKKTPSSKAFCGSFYVTGGTSAVVNVKSIKPTSKYAVWVTVQQLAAPDTVNGEVSFPGKHKPGPHPAPVPFSEFFLNGCNTG